MRISRLHAPVSALGHGRRAGVWVQGCSVRCPGCVSLDTWDADGGGELSIAEIGSWLHGVPGPLDGVTVSGGEPTDQPADLAELLGQIRAVEEERGERWDVLVYTGRSRSAALHLCPALSSHADAVVVGPYRAYAAGTDPLRGSANQQVVALSELGRARYPIADAGAESSIRPRMDVVVDDAHLWLVGIPRPGELERLNAALAERGVKLNRASWLA